MLKIFYSVLFLIASPLMANPSEDVKELISSHTQFAFSLYPTIEKNDDNLVFSPYSISTCLCMVYLGARGDTQTQMQQALAIELDRKNIAKASCALSLSLQPKSSEKSYSLKLANAAWVEPKTFLLADFRYAIEEQFKAKLAKVNFADPETARKTINDWISTQTQGKIPELLLNDDVDAQTRLVLTNAVYFQGNWVKPFDPKLTDDWPFHPTSEQSMPVKMLTQVLSAPYYENDLVQAIALPFKGLTNEDGHLAFVILLPKSAGSWDMMISEVPDQFNSWIAALSNTDLELKFPKFKINSRTYLNEPLKLLGMEDAFDNDANFTGIDGLRDLVLTKVIHQADFELDETGVIATAATSAGIGLTSANPQPPSAHMIVDHPFLFFLIDLKSKEMLFMGKIVQPNG